MVSWESSRTGKWVNSILTSKHPDRDASAGKAKNRGEIPFKYVQNK